MVYDEKLYIKNWSRISDNDKSCVMTCIENIF